MVRVILTILFLSAVPAARAGDWVKFVDESDNRLISDPVVGIDDWQEKDYAWGDVDHDGDIDLICVRKQPFTTTGKRTNVLFLNEDGVLVDRTAEFATASDIPGDQGFLTPTNDRDVVLVDVNDDGWLDIVTAVTLTDNQAKHISHPRVYINLGEQPPGSGKWQGYEYQDGRIPQLHPIAGPRFNAVVAGDVTGDGMPDLYFVDSDPGGNQIFDFNDRLLVNDGTGFFSDESSARMIPEMLQSAFGVAAAITDINNDGTPDIVKDTTLSSPQYVAIAYNDPSGIGSFSVFDIVISSIEPLYMSVGDLNNDGLTDLVITEHNEDLYLLSLGNGANGLADFETHSFPLETDGHGGNSIIVDLNNDGWNDVLIADVDLDVAGCNRTSDILRNNGDGPHVTFTSDAGNLSANMLTGVYDFAVFDLNGDDLLDIVAGRCVGTRIWIQQPPADLDGDGDVDAADLALLLGSWGPCADPDECSADLNGDDAVNAADLAILLGNWG